MKLNYQKLAKQIVKSMLIKPKENPGIKLAEKRFGKSFINKLMKKKTPSLSGFDEKEKAIIKRLQGFEYGPLIYKANGKYKVKKYVGEVVRIAYTETDPRCVKLARHVREECWRLGCNVMFIPRGDEDSKTYFRIVPEHSLVELPKISEILAKEIDVRIGIGDSENPSWSRGLEKKLLLSSPSSMCLWEIMDKREVRWCGVGFPVKMKRNHYVVSPKTYETVYLNTLLETFSKLTMKNCEYYRKALKDGNKIRVTASDGTDLTFRIKGRPVLVDDGKLDDYDMKRGDVGLNIPSGEVFLAPLENSANGKILFDFTMIQGFGLIRKLRLTFKNGRVIKYETDKKGMQTFKRFLNSNTGEKDRIAELGIGCNEAAEFIGTTIVDEKIFGSLHIAIGYNKGAYHGKNKASSHLDMIKIMHGVQGKVFVDGKLIMDNGKPVSRK